jgi:hypothetical protein
MIDAVTVLRQYLAIAAQRYDAEQGYAALTQLERERDEYKRRFHQADSDRLALMQHGEQSLVERINAAEARVEELERERQAALDAMVRHMNAERATHARVAELEDALGDIVNCRSYVVEDAGDGHPSIVVRTYDEALEEAIRIARAVWLGDKGRLPTSDEEGGTK